MDVGGSFMKFAVSPAPGVVVPLEKVATPVGDWRGFVDVVAALTERHSHEVDARSPLGLSIAGLVDPRDGTATSANVPCITGRHLAEELGAILRRKVVAANDADCMTLAEANDGAGRGHPVVFCTIIGTGIGGGLAVGGRLTSGTGGVAGEWGHGPIVNTVVTIGSDKVEIPRLACGCGQSGCVDTIGGARGIERLHHLLHGRRESSFDILEAWQAGETRAGRTVAIWLELVSDPLALAVNITGASIVPVGGGLASVAPLIAALDDAVRKRILNRFDRALVTPAIWREDGGTMGAAVLARQGG